MSETTEDFDSGAFDKHMGHLLGESKNQGLQKMNVGKTLLAVTKAAANAGLFVPSELTVLGKTLLQLDEVGRILDPAFDPNASIRRNIATIATQHLNKNATRAAS